MSDLVIVPQPGGSDPYVELSRSRQGRIFEKHILSEGPLLYPKAKGGVVNVDGDFMDTMIANFSAGYCDIVQVPIAGAKNEHTEDPLRNIGEVIGLSKRDGKLFAQIDARNENAADALGKTLLGASAMLSTDYIDTKTMKKVGPTLLHVAVTNRPYITGLDEYQEVVAASANGNEMSGAMILTAPTHDSHTEETKMDKAELIRLAKTEHGLDIEALQEKASKYDATLELTNRLTTELAETGMLTLSNSEEATADDLIGAVVELSKSNVALTNRVSSLEVDKKNDAAVARVEGLIREAKILPKDKDAQVELLLTNPDLFERLVPEKAIVTLSQEDLDELGADISLTAGGTDATVQSEIDRIASSTAAAPYVRSAAA